MLSSMRTHSMLCGRRVAIAAAASSFATSRAFSSPTAASYVATPSIDLKVTSRDSLDSSATDLLIIPYAATTKKRAEIAKYIADNTSSHCTAAVRALVEDLIKDDAFTAKKDSNHIVYMGATSPYKHIALLGVASGAQLSQSLGSQIAAVSKKTRATSATILLDTLPLTDSDLRQSLVAMKCNLYQDKRFKGRPKNTTEEPDSDKVKLQSVQLIGASPEINAKLPDAIAYMNAVCDGVTFAKDLVGAPANVKTPITIAKAVQELAESSGLSCKILAKEECESLGMGGYIAVQQGSRFPPQFVHLTYSPPNPSRKIALIGKGLTFDSGGYNLKVGNSSIEMMKVDMGGCAAVFGAAKAISAIKPDDVEVHFISALCENMVSAEAIRPGDIVTASNGKTIEILNTDAEGRLTLADALVYAEKLKVDSIIDLATLTGACVVALGEGVAGLFTENEDLRSQIEKAAQVTNEKLWSLPIEESYAKQVKSTLADVKNIGGGKGGGAITAALFLKEFVETTSWAHVDIAGPVWDNSKKSATGYGVRFLVEYVLNNSRK